MMIDDQERGWALMRSFADAQGFDKRAVCVCRKSFSTVKKCSGTAFLLRNAFLCEVFVPHQNCLYYNSFSVL